MKKIRLSVLTSLVLAAFSFPANADEPIVYPTIYGQYPKNYEQGKNDDRFLIGSVSDAVPGQIYGQMAADNFTITDSGALVTGVSWWGGSDNTNGSATSNFNTITIKILSAIDRPFNAKYNVVYEETVPFDNTIKDENAYVGFSSFNNSIVYQQQLTFKEAVPLCAGAQYWIAIGTTNSSSEENANNYVWYGANPDNSDPKLDNTTWLADFEQSPVTWEEFGEDQGFELKGIKVPSPAGACVTPSPEPSPTPTSTATSTATSTPTGAVDYTTSPTPTATPVAKTPIPAAVWLFGSGLAGLFAVARRRKSKV